MGEENTILDLGYFRVTLEAKIKKIIVIKYLNCLRGEIRTSFIECLQFAGII